MAEANSHETVEDRQDLPLAIRMRIPTHVQRTNTITKPSPNLQTGLQIHNTKPHPRTQRGRIETANWYETRRKANTSNKLGRHTHHHAETSITRGPNIRCTAVRYDSLLCRNSLQLGIYAEFRLFRISHTL